MLKKVTIPPEEYFWNEFKKNIKERGCGTIDEEEFHAVILRHINRAMYAEMKDIADLLNETIDLIEKEGENEKGKKGS